MKTKKNTNPWLEIPASDYEGYMNSPEVHQLSLLSGLFRESLKDFDSGSIALLGAATGNGLEHIKNQINCKVTVIDINPEYLEILKNRFDKNIKDLEIIEADLEELRLAEGSYSLIFGGLVFEYVDIKAVLPGIFRWQEKGGVLVAVPQLPAEKNMISETKFRSLRLLNSVMKLVDPGYFKKEAEETVLKLIREEIKQPFSGKDFYVGSFQKP